MNQKKKSKKCHPLSTNGPPTTHQGPTLSTLLSQRHIENGSKPRSESAVFVMVRTGLEPVSSQIYID